jgi:ethanolamine utilization protein EutM
MGEEALGLLETRGLVAAIEACDAMLKSAQVRLLRRQIISPALVTLCITGETAAVRSALDAGARAAERVGLVLSTHLIPRPGPGIVEMAASLHHDSWQRASQPLTDRPANPAGMTEPVDLPETLSQLESMPVRQLRALARGLESFPLGGRQISVARREELLELLQAALFDHS